MLQLESAEQPLVTREDRAGLLGPVRQPPRGENTAFVRHLHRGPSVLRRDREDDVALRDDRVHVIHLAGDELLQQAGRPPVAKRVERTPQLFAICHLFDPRGGG